MEEEKASSPRLRDDKEITRGLREALLGDAPAFFDGLYDVRGTDDPDLRPLVEGARDESARMFALAREKLGARSCEMIGEERSGTSYRVVFLINGQERIEVTVDDIYEQNGSLHTRDVMQIRRVTPE